MNEWEIAAIFGALGLVLGVLVGRIWAYSNIIAGQKEVDKDTDDVAWYLRKNEDGTYKEPHVKRIQILPANTDRLILSYPHFLSVEQREQLQHVLMTAWEDDTCKVIVLEGGIQLEAVVAARGELAPGLNVHQTSADAFGSTEVKRKPPPPPEPPPTRTVHTP